MAIRQEVKDIVKNGAAILATDRFAYNNSLAQGRKMTADFSKLMLRAYNAEADNCVRSVRAGTVASAKQRLDRSVESIAKLGKMMEMRVAPEYHLVRLREIELTGDYLFKVQEEREAARAERERLREERRAEAELQAERQRLEKEREHYANALARLASQDSPEQAEKLRERLSAIDDAIEQNDRSPSTFICCTSQRTRSRSRMSYGRRPARWTPRPYSLAGPFSTCWRACSGGRQWWRA